MKKIRYIHSLARTTEAIAQAFYTQLNKSPNKGYICGIEYIFYVETEWTMDEKASNTRTHYVHHEWKYIHTQWNREKQPHNLRTMRKNVQQRKEW